MTSTDFPPMLSSAKHNRTTMSIGAHRHVDLPASALPAGGRVMPAPWQTRGTPQASHHHKLGAPVRSFGEILTSPFRPLLSSTPRKIALGGGVLVLAIFFLIF